MKTQVYHVDRIPIFIDIERAGQDYLALDHTVLTEVRARIPVTLDGFINPRLEFGFRCQFFGEILRPSWGTIRSEYRRNCKVFRADSYPIGLAKSLEYIEVEIDNLLLAVSKRQEALEAAFGFL